MRHVGSNPEAHSRDSSTPAGITMPTLCASFGCMHGGIKEGRGIALCRGKWIARYC